MHHLLPESLTDQRCAKHGWLILLVFAAMLYLPGLGSMPMMDRDEPRFAHATVEMMQRGTWTVPYFNNEYRFDKPPLTYWWMRLHYNLFGINEFSARLHSVVATWLVAWVIFGIARRMAGGRAGLMAGSAWLLTFQVFIHSRLCVADMPMVLCVAISGRALIEILFPQSERIEHAPAPFSRWHWVLYTALGFGFLAKGPIAWIVPGLTLALMRFAFWRQPLPWSRLHMGKGSLIALGIAGAWGIPALIETKGLFWKVGMGEHVIDRGTKAFNGRFPLPGYYFATAFGSLFPWIALLPQVWTQVRSKWNAQLAFLVSWFIAPYLIFTFYATQLAHYVMPGFPAAMVLFAVCGTGTNWPRWKLVWSIYCIAFLVVAGCIVLGGAHIEGLPAPLIDLLKHGSSLLASLSWLGIFAVVCYRKQWKVHFAVAIAGVITLSVSMAAVMYDLRTMHPAAKLANQLLPLAPKTELYAWQFTEPSLVFHFDHEWKYGSKLESVTRHLDRKGPRITVLQRREWTLNSAINAWRAGNSSPAPERDFSKDVDALIANHPDQRCIEFTGFNAARSSWVELRVLVRP